MRYIWVIAKNTFREIIRDRILYGLVVFAILLIGVSIALGQLSFAEQARISADFGFTGIQLSAAILAIFVGSSLVSREIEKQTILTLLARPISRSQFLIGKFFGLSCVITVVMIALSLVLAVVVANLNLEIQLNFAVALFGILLEALLLLALSMFFGVITRPVLTVSFAVGLFFMGHWVNSLYFFIEKSESQSFKALGTFITWVVPNFEKFNWRSAPIYGTEISLAEIGQSFGYAFGWLLLIMTLTTIIFKRRDFV